MKQRMSIMKNNNEGARSGEHTAPAGNMNTSFSAMNSSLSQKWMTKKSQITTNRADGGAHQQMSSTMAPGFGPQQPALVSPPPSQQPAAPEEGTA